MSKDPRDYELAEDGLKWLKLGKKKAIAEIERNRQSGDPSAELIYAVLKEISKQ
jgi:hypothetical protein